MNTLWPLEDNQNTVRDVLNDSGTLEEHIGYSPFGQVVASQSTDPGSVVLVNGYTGAFTDVVTCDQLNGVRWYNPATQRWICQDPIESGTNWDEYCGDDPTNETDPSGLQPPLTNYNGYQLNNATRIAMAGDPLVKGEVSDAQYAAWVAAQNPIPPSSNSANQTYWVVSG